MTMSNIRGHIYGLIAEIQAAEKITKVKLGVLSRDLLMYVPESDDIAAVNRLFEVLTPVNKRVAIEFFTHFLPWDAERDTDKNFIRFGGKTKGEKKRSRSAKNIKEFLADEKNNIWTWAETEIQVEKKKKDFAGMITRQVTKALEGDEASDTPAISASDVLSAVFAGGVSLEAFLEAAEAIETQQQAELEAKESALDAIMSNAGAA